MGRVSQQDALKKKEHGKTMKRTQPLTKMDASKKKWPKTKHEREQKTREIDDGVPRENE